MRIKSEIKLNFDDVLLQPKRSTLTSRADVKMTRTFNFINSGKQLEFCPIFASNMDGVGTFSMAKVLQEYKMMTVITKSTTIDQHKHDMLRKRMNLRNQIGRASCRERV